MRNKTFTLKSRKQLVASKGTKFKPNTRGSMKRIYLKYFQHTPDYPEGMDVLMNLTVVIISQCIQYTKSSCSTSQKNKQTGCGEVGDEGEHGK